MKKLFCIILVLSLLLVSCGKSGDETPGESAKASVTEGSSETVGETTEPAPFSEYETYTDAEGKKVIVLFKKDFEKKYTADNYYDVTLQELRDITNETLLMFDYFDKVVIDFNVIGDRFEEDNDSKILKSSIIYKGEKEIFRSYFGVNSQKQYLIERFPDDELVKKAFNENVRCFENGCLVIKNAAISQSGDNIRGSALLAEISEVLFDRIWYYLGMPRCIRDRIGTFFFDVCIDDRNETEVTEVNSIYYSGASENEYLIIKDECRVRTNLIKYKYAEDGSKSLTISHFRCPLIVPTPFSAFLCHERK